MNHKETLSKIKLMLGIQVALESMKLDNGVEIEAEVFEAGQDVFIVQDGEKIAVPAGEYKLEDGRSLIIAEEGVIAEIAEATSEEEAPAEEAPVAEEELSNEEVPSKPKKVVESISKELFFSTIDELKAEIAELKLSKIEVISEPAEIELSTEKIVHNPAAQTEKENVNFSRTKVQTTTQRVFNKLFK